MSRNWLAYDLCVRSDFDLPGATQLTAPRDADIVITAGIADVGAPGETRGPFTLGDRGIRIDTPACAILCSQGNRAMVEVRSGAPAAAIEAALTGLALPVLLWMRGGIVLHAAAAILPGHDGAIAFLGHSGAGKSTVARELLDIGATIVADDTLSLRFRDDRAWVSGLPAQLGSGAHGDPTSTRAVAPDRRAVAAPLAAICVLEPFDGIAGVEMLDHAQRTLALIEYRYRVKIPRLLGRVLPLLPDLARIAASIGGARWRRAEAGGAVTESLWTLSRPV